MEQSVLQRELLTIGQKHVMGACMNKVYMLILLLCAFVFVGICSSPYSVLTIHASESFWDYSYSSLPGEGYSIIQTKDNSYVIAGTSQGHFLLVKVNSNGELQWNKTFGEGAAKCVIQTPDDYLLLVGNSTIFNLLKTDKDGNVIWQRTYDSHPELIALNSLIQTNDDGYALVGNTYNDTGIMIKTDTNGNVQWTKLYGDTYPQRKLTLITDIIQTEDEGFIVAAERCIVKLDSNGNQLWYRDNAGTAYFLLPTDDGGYFFSDAKHVPIPISSPPDETEFIPTGYPGQNSMLIKADSEGNWKWRKIIVDGNYSEFKAGIKTSEGGYVVAGILSAQHHMQKVGNITVPSLPNHFSVGLVKLDDDGNIFGNNTYPPATQGSNFINSIIESADGYYVFTGTYASNSGEKQLWIAKTQIDPTPDNISPIIRVLSPKNQTYNNKPYLTFYVSEPASWIGYSLDGKSNITLTTNTTLSDLTQGTHTIVIYANDTSGNLGISNIVFFNSQTDSTSNLTISTSPSTTLPPSISPIIPQETIHAQQPQLQISLEWLLVITIAVVVFAVAIFTIYIKKQGDQT
jgi:hypothetical protein